MQSIDAILLIHKQITNQISSDEKKILKSWLKEDVKNKILYKDISMIWNASKNAFDPSKYIRDQTENGSEDYNKHDADKFLRLKNKYGKQKPDEELTKSIGIEKNDRFSQLILSALGPKELEKFQDVNFEVGLKPILQILCSTAISILSSEYLQYHLEILNGIEQFSSVKGILISDIDDKVVYATNKKFKNTYLLEVFPIDSVDFKKLTISDMQDHQLLALPIYHLYGRIGMVLLII